MVDQVLASGTNFLATVMVARRGTPEQFGIFSIFLIAYYLLAGFSRSVPHAIAMTIEWNEDSARNAFFFLPPCALGFGATLVLLPVFWALDNSFTLLPLFLLPLLVQDAVRMRAFAVQKPQVAIWSDIVWLAVIALGLPLASEAAGTAILWCVGGLCGGLVAKPWRNVRWQRRPMKGAIVSATLEFVSLSGLNYVGPLLAVPLVSMKGAGALQGAGVLRGPVALLVQVLLFHRMTGPPIPREACLQQAFRLAMLAFAATLVCVPLLVLLKDTYGPRLLGATWPMTEPLITPTILTLLLGSIAFGPATVVRKMGLFNLSAKVQITLAPCFLGLALIGALVADSKGFLYGVALAYTLSSIVWWVLLPRVAAGAIGERSGLND